MKKILKILGVLLSIILLAVVGLVLYVNLSWEKTFEAPYPEITVTSDSASIARGKYLAFGPAHCATCHVPIDKIKAVDEGAIVPLSGGWELNIPPGTFRAPNLTPDEETGIGRYTDEELARTLRHMVSPNGTMLFPFMPFQNMTDEDVASVIAFLRSQEPVRNEVPKTEYSFLGKALLAMGVMQPQGPSGTPPKRIEKEVSIEYGSYLANSVANCNGCHTERNLKTGEFTGPQLAGGMVMPPDDFTQGFSFVTPNLTPHETGVIAEWSEAQFIERIRAGRVIPTSPMPWGTYSQMEEVELKAIYQYLMSLDPVENNIDKVVYEPGEEI